MEDVVQVVHPLAKAEIVGAKKRRVLWECQGNQVPIEVAIKVSLALSLLNFRLRMKADRLSRRLSSS
jgi:hypothetical protein